jgi:tripartite-type tricarboxylate transporter receptor subunit TctC
MELSIKRIMAAAMGTALISLAASAPAQEKMDYPNRTIRIVVGYVAGGTNDILARIVAAELTTVLGQPVIVENRPGASAIIGTQTAAPDGYTLLLGGTGPMAFNAALYSKLPYSPTKDFAPISMIGSFPLVLVATPGAATSLKHLVDFSKTNPDKANYGSSSAAFQLPTELLKMQTGAEFTHVPYKGSAEVLQAVMAGQVAMALIDPGPAGGPIKAGKLKGIAVTSGKRLPEFPDMPTLQESGVDVKVLLWSALFAPAGTPETIIKRLNKEIARIVKLPSVREKMEKLVMTPESSTSQELAKTVANDIHLWSRVAKANNIKASE